MFRAYRTLASTRDPGYLLPAPPPGDGDHCTRCGTCCATLNPGVTDNDRYRHWVDAGNPLSGFMRAVARAGASEEWYSGWFCGDARLRMCPALLYCPDNGNHFCAVYHMGPGHRPEGCEGFRPNPPHCEISQRPLVF